MAALTTMANRLEADLVELVGYMGEDPAKMDAETLFQLVVSFGDALHEAVQDIRAIEAKTTSKAPSKTGADLVRFARSSSLSATDQHVCSHTDLLGAVDSMRHYEICELAQAFVVSVKRDRVCGPPREYSWTGVGDDEE